MTLDYDPFSHEAMTDAFPLYKRMRAEQPVYFMEKYNAWAMTRFEDVWKAGRQFDAYTATTGVSPAQILLGEPVPVSFMTMDMPEHSKYRQLIAADYTRDSVDGNKPRIRALVREILEPLLERGEFEFYSEFANRVTTLNAAHVAGVPRSDGERVRSIIDRMLGRVENQVGTSETNGMAAGELDAYFRELMAEIRKDPSQATGHIAQWLESNVDGKSFTDDDFVMNLFSMMVTGSETTPLSASGTLVYLSENPDQLDAVRKDPGLIHSAFMETLRYDQPTNMLGRRLAKDIEVRGQQLKEGQGVMFIWASANRDENEFENADVYDLHRSPKRTLTFGRGVHRCLGEWMGLAMADAILEEFLGAVGCNYTIEPGQAGRIYGEFLSGYNRCVVKFEPTGLT